MLRRFNAFRKKRYLVLAGSGMIFALPFLFPQLDVISFFSAVPLFAAFFLDIAEKNASVKKFLKYIIAFATPFYLLVYIWFLWFYPLDFAGLSPGESMIVTLCAWIGFPVLQTLVLLIVPPGIYFLGNNIARLSDECAVKPFLTPLMCASVYVIAEWVQSWFLTGLTWAKLSVSQYQNLPFIQSISVFGTYFTSFIIIFINASAALYLVNKFKNTVGRKKNTALILAAFLLYFANSYFGLLRIILYQYPENTVTVQIVQGNMSSNEKWGDNGVADALNRYRELIADGVEEYSYGGSRDISGEDSKDNKKVDVCVLPETAVPTGVYYESSIYNILAETAKENNIGLLAGVFFDDYENEREYNAMMAFLPDSDEFITPYGKRHLVPFGEYLPLENIIIKLFPFVENMAMFDSQIHWGEGENLIDINGVKYGGLICFDSIFPELSRDSVNAGANILTVITNDSWYKDSIGIYQHNAQSVLRAVENNRYVVRAANTGISSFISPVGEILNKTEVFETTVMTHDIGVIEDNRTIYTIYGDIILYISAAFSIVCFTLPYLRKRKRV